MTNRKINDDTIGYDKRSRSGEPIYDIRGLYKYLNENNIDYKERIPQEIADMFIIGYEK